MEKPVFSNDRFHWLRRELHFKSLHWLIELDIRASDYIEQRFRNKSVVRVMRFLSNVLLYTLLAVLLFIAKRYGLDWMNILFNLIVLLVLSEFVLKRIFKRKRPYYLDKIMEGRVVKNFSFPSSHSMTAGYILGVFIRYGLRKSFGFSLVAFVSCFIPFTRVALNVHFISDVVVGFVFGFLWGVFWR